MSEAGPQGSAVRPSFVREVCLTVLGSGYAPFASGSWGSLVAALIFCGVWFLIPMSNSGRDALLLCITLGGILISSVLSIVWGEWAIARWGRKDPKQFVLDEFAGQWVALLLLPPIAAKGLVPLGFVVGVQFFLFRLFDVLKPPPARQIDRDWPGGWGILCDDLVAGFYALLIGQLLWRVTPLAMWLGL